VASIIFARFGCTFWIRVFELLTNFTKTHSSLLRLSPMSVQTLAIVDPILEDYLSCRTDSDEDDKRICIDLRILRHIHSKLVDGLSRACFE